MVEQKTPSLDFREGRNSLEVERESKLLADNIIASALYAVKLLETDGVVVLRKTTT